MSLNTSLTKSLDNKMMNRLYPILILFLLVLASNAQTVSAIEVNPNPFVKRTLVSYTVQIADTLSIFIYNQLGQAVDTVIYKQLKAQGMYQDSVKMDSKADGVYLLSIKDRTKLLVGLKIIKSSTTGIENIQENSKIKIYPNPAKNQITVELPESETSNLKLELFGLLGQVLFTKNGPATKELIDVRLLPEGIYYLKVQSNLNQKIFKIIKE